MIKINETERKDLNNIMTLWNNGEVMKYVGFPEGLNITFERLNKWYDYMKLQTNSKHYSIYDEEKGYCGEAFYSYDELHDLASLDIKLFPFAQGGGIGYLGLKHSINELFANTNASRCYVDPHSENIKAWKLYDKLGFECKSRPSHLEPAPTYLELSKDRWMKPRLQKLNSSDGFLVYEMLQEIPATENGFSNAANSLSYESFKEWLKEKSDFSEGINLPPYRVPETYYWLSVKGEFVGLIKLRHYLNKSLEEAGGNIGYGIRPSKRGLGYGKLMLGLVLEEAKKLGLEKVLITVDDNNESSVKVALANNGKIVNLKNNYVYIEIYLK